MNFDRPLLPLITYDPNSPPVMFDVKVPDQAKYIVPLVISAICNEATGKANTRAVRMFTYNVLSNNCWNNNEMQELVTLAIYYCILQTNKGLYNRLDFAINDCVRDIVTLYASAVMFQNPVVKSVSNPNEIAAANENVQVFNNLKGEIHSMMNGGFYQMNGGMQPNNMMPGPGVVNPAMMGMMQQAYQPQNQMHFQHSNPVMNHQNTFNNNAGVNNASISARAVNDADDRYSNRMRNKQEVINQSSYFSEVTSTNATPAVAQPQQTPVEEKVKPRIFNVDPTGFSGTFNVPPYKFDNLIISSTLNELILDIKLNQLIGHEGNNLNWKVSDYDFMICSGDVVMPIADNFNVRSFIEILASSDNLYTMCRSLKRIKNDAIKLIGTETGDDNEGVLAAVEIVSRFFLKKVNSFLANELGTGIEISDFIEDAPELAKYIEKKHNDNHLSQLAFSRFEHFENYLFKSCFVHGEDYTASAFDSLGLDYQVIDENSDDSSDQKYIFDSKISLLRSAYNVVMTRLASRHIDIPNKGVKFTADMNCMMYDVLFEMATKDTDPTVTNILVTRDNVVYKFWTDTDNPTEVLVMKL